MPRLAADLLTSAWLQRQALAKALVEALHDHQQLCQHTARKARQPVNGGWARTDALVQALHDHEQLRQRRVQLVLVRDAWAVLQQAPLACARSAIRDKRPQASDTDQRVRALLSQSPRHPGVNRVTCT